MAPTRAFTWLPNGPIQQYFKTRAQHDFFRARFDGPGEIMLLDVDSAPSYLFDTVKADIRVITDLERLKDVVLVLDKVYGNKNDWVYKRLGGHL